VRGATIQTADTTEWLAALWQKLQPWTIASAVVASGLAGAPATDTLGLPDGELYVARLAPHGRGVGSQVGAENLPLSFEEQVAAYQQAQAEAKRALAILQGMRDEVGLPEFREYLDAIDGVLEATPDVTSLAQTQAFTLGLQAARLQLLDQTTSLRVWLKLASVLDPETEDFKVPHRFIVWDQNDHEEEPFRFSKSELRARQSVARFLGDDGDSSTSRA
jgi:hypothetical protein